ncbi:MAG: hypothetical protein EAX86_10090 [Candidatus Heimdallarchaeota archaeon]|nr:hypothetical protein [Candidatus Heimdallarchaeota archaeon]
MREIAGVKNCMMYKFCQFLLTTKAETIAYCLKYREYINQCPDKCLFFLHGSSGSMEEVSTNNFLYNCLYFSRSKEENTNSIRYFCELYEMDNPLCKSCQFPKFKSKND